MIFLEKMVQITDQINRKKQETSQLERENKEVNQKYLEITTKIKEKEKEIEDLQAEIVLANKKNEELKSSVEFLSKEKFNLKQDIEQKETSIFLNSKNFSNPKASFEQNHYQNPSETKRLKEKDHNYNNNGDEPIVNEVIEPKNNGCLNMCKCVLY